MSTSVSSTAQLLKDPAGLLEGSGKRMRHVKLKPGREVNAAALRDLIDAAYLDIKVRLGADTVFVRRVTWCSAHREP